MQFFLPFPSTKPIISQSRHPVVNDMLRALEGSNSQHLLIRGLPGSGRHTVAQAVISLGKKIGRKHSRILDVGGLATALYESADSSELFASIREMAKSYRGALIVIDSPDLLIDGVERHETRRLVRFFTELLSPHDLRVLLIATEDQAVTLLNLSPSLPKLFSSHTVPALSEAETVDIISDKIDVRLAESIVDLACRFSPREGLPGSAISLLQASSDRATQSGQQLAIEQVQATVAQARKLPLSAVSTSDMSDVRELNSKLKQRVLGQDHAVETVTKIIQRAHAGLASDNRPIASFLFLGPSGVGKTELAKSLADLLFHSSRAFTRIDMSEFSESHTVQRLIGAPPGYVGYEEGGQLTNPVDQEPYSLVLLDEIEKAHPKVFDTFLQLLDDGRLTDGRGKTVDFRHTIVVATSNIGLHEIVAGAQSGQIHDRETFLRKSLLPLLVEHFRPEFLNRFDAIIAFAPLAPDRLVQIGRAQVGRMQERLAKQALEVEVSEQTLQALAQRAYQPAYGARPMRRLIADEIESVIAQRIVEGSVKPGETIRF